MYDHLKVFFGNSNPELASEICGFLGIQHGKVRIHAFSNNNIKVKIEENVRNDDVFVIQSASSPVNDNLMELLIMVDALRYASAGRITVVMPYYFYSRSDKKDQPRISIAARLVADLLQTAGANRILTMQLHSPQIMGFSRIPVDQLLPTQIFIKYFQKLDLSNAVFVAPDIGGAKNVSIYAKALNKDMVIMDKVRIGDKEEVQVRNIIGDASGRDVVLMDDEVLSGGSMLEAIDALTEQKVKSIYACCTHGFFSRNALDKFEASSVEEIVTTNTIPIKKRQAYRKLNVLSVAELFANAIRAIHVGDSVGALFWVDESEL
ncbi:ribose-phosphate pyrophosphokinase [candidate division KSB1 bacterium]|nr:ribose-phosphate pyrophosphokinase [candidate division KSB1 bacterium]